MRRFLFVLFIVVLTGCSLFTREMEKPKAQVLSLNVKEFEKDGATIHLNVELKNPNAFEIEVGALTYDVELAGKPFASGKREEGFRLEPNGTSVVEVPLKVNYSAIFGTLGEIFGKRTAPFKVKGAAKLGVFNVPFEKTGEIKLRD